MFIKFNELFFSSLRSVLYAVGTALGFTDAFQGLANQLLPTLFPENYAFAERKNFAGNALQSDGIQRGSPPLRLEKPTGEDRYGLKQTRDK